MESINEKIKQLRIKTGVSQAEVSRSAGIKQSSYASIEKGDTKSISIEVGKGIAKALGISFNELFEIEAEQNNLLIEELKSEIEKRNRIQEITDKELALKDKLIDSYEKTLGINEDLSILWVKSYLHVVIAQFSVELQENKTTKEEIKERMETIFGVIASFFLFTVSYDGMRVDKLEKELRGENNIIYQYYFKPFIEFVRKIYNEAEKLK